MISVVKLQRECKTPKPEYYLRVFGYGVLSFGYKSLDPVIVRKSKRSIIFHLHKPQVYQPKKRCRRK